MPYMTMDKPELLPAVLAALDREIAAMERIIAESRGSVPDWKRRLRKLRKERERLTKMMEHP